MENIKRSTEGALDGSASSRQRTHHQESASCNASIVPKQTTDSTQPLGSSLALICHWLPRDNDDLITSIGWTGEKLADCLSIVESALAIIQGRSPPEANLVRERLAKVEVRISGEIFTASFCFFFISPPGFLIIPFLNLLDLIA